MNTDNQKALTSALYEALKTSCENLDFDIRCLDWFSYTPDRFREIAYKGDNNGRN